jgi:hypothetical protein
MEGVQIHFLGKNHMIKKNYQYENIHMKNKIPFILKLPTDMIKQLQIKTNYKLKQISNYERRYGRRSNTYL